MPLESAPIPEVKEETELEEEIALPWKVIVLNDPVNLMNYVVMVFRKVFGYDEQKATKHFPRRPAGQSGYSFASGWI